MVDSGYFNIAIDENAAVRHVTGAEKLYYNEPWEGFAKNMEGPGYCVSGRCRSGMGFVPDDLEPMYKKIKESRWLLWVLFCFMAATANRKEPMKHQEPLGFDLHIQPIPGAVCIYIYIYIYIERERKRKSYDLLL